MHKHTRRDVWGRNLKLVPTVILSVFFLSPTMAALAQQEKRTLDGVAALVNDHLITISDIRNYAGQVEDGLIAAYGQNPAELEKRLIALHKDALNTLIDRALILDEFQKKGYQLPEYTVDSRIREIIATEYNGNRLEFLKSLRAQGLTLEQFRKRIREQIVVASLTHREIGSVVSVSPFKMQQYYKANVDKFKADDESHLRMIMLKKEGLDADGVAEKRRMADEIIAKLDSGATFSALAKLYSEQTQAQNGGDWGWIDRKTLRPELSDAAFALKQGEHSAVMDTKEGFYILFAEEVKKARVVPLAEVRDQIEKVLEQEERARLQKRWLDKLRKGAFIRKYPPFDAQ